MALVNTQLRIFKVRSQFTHYVILKQKAQNR